MADCEYSSPSQRPAGRSGLRLTVFRFVLADEVIKVICMGGLGTN